RSDPAASIVACPRAGTFTFAVILRGAMRTIVILAAIVMGVLCSPLSAQTTRPAEDDFDRWSAVPDPAHGDRWQDFAKREPLSDQQIQTLARDKFIIVPTDYKQVFTPYYKTGPVFITSDSILNGYSVLFEASIERIERHNATRLLPLLQAIWLNLNKPDP